MFEAIYGTYNFVRLIKLNFLSVDSIFANSMSLVATIDGKSIEMQLMSLKKVFESLSCIIHSSPIVVTEISLKVNAIRVILQQFYKWLMMTFIMILLSSDEFLEKRMEEMIGMHCRGNSKESSS